jgi:DUF4097 and DUF4098 domain-containing protein YvlB
MKSRLSFFALVVVSAVAVTAGAETFTKQDKKSWDIPLSAFGSFWIHNVLGGIDVTGIEGDRIAITAVRTAYAADRAAVDEGLELCQVNWEGSEKVRVVRTQSRAVRARCSVNYIVQVPRSADLKIAGRQGDIVIRNVNGNVTVTSFNSNVTMANVSGASAVEIANGHIVYNYLRSPLANAQATVINGNIDVYVPAEANFEWAADTLMGDMLTTFPVRGTLSGSSFRGHINAPGGPTIRTQSVAGRTHMLVKGTSPAQSRSVRDINASERVPPATGKWDMPMTKLQVPIVGGDFVFRFPDRFTDIAIGEVRGNAKIVMAAGGIDLAVVYGDTDVTTGGGPMNLGELMSPVTAKTGGGDVLVRAARLGGDVSTVGGAIRVLYAGGPMTLVSGGGDISVRQANGAINAKTSSGDITITADPTSKGVRINALTSKGNIVINLTTRFGADIDATVMTSDADANAIFTDFPSLSIRREHVGGRTRIRATGKINGGGERIELSSDSGDIRITSQATSPVMVMTPSQ